MTPRTPHRPRGTRPWARYTKARRTAAVAALAAATAASYGPSAQASERATGAAAQPAARAIAAPSVPDGLRAACPRAPGVGTLPDALPAADIGERGDRGRRPWRGGGAAWVEPAAPAAAYRLPAAPAGTQTIAVSIAYNTPHLAQYLAKYRSQYRLPACTTASGCLRIVNQAGKPAPLPTSGVGTGWDLEVTADVSMVSASCPACHLLVVEGNSPSTADLAATEVTAAALGAQVVSNSYGQRETGAALATAKAYDQPGHTIVAASGDSGFTPDFPADLATVTAVCGGDYLCAAKPGYDAPTGLGSPDGTGAF